MYERIWLIQAPGQHEVRRSGEREPGSVEYVLAQHYNELIDWIGEHKSCNWWCDENGIWQTECGNAFEFYHDGPKENEYAFCPYCGSKIVPPNELAEARPERASQRTK